ncbi:MAG: YjbH domain-containing protein [Turneriella sp.]|nr:YjbH domain-containing protein [Turneriella sp.]
MKIKIRILWVALFAITLPLSAYTSTNMAGQTGLIATPNARIVWEGSNSNVALTAGYHYANPGQSYHQPNVNIALFDRFELGGMFNAAGGSGNNDFMLHGKLRFSPWSGRGNSALAIGGNYQSLEPGAFSVGQVYLAATYAASFFGMEADTSLVLGKTFGSITRSGDLDFSMGFDLNFFPSLFQGYVRWINELTNYDYLYGNAPTRAGARGAFNTGFRIAVLKALSNVKLDLNLLLTDALDDERGFAVGAVFGARF